MRFHLLFLFFFFITRTGFSQGMAGDYPNIPAKETHTAEGIAQYINTHYQGNEEKIAAIYNWIVYNIKYDADSIHYVILDEDNDQRISTALKRKAGVCENFAALFTDLCNLCQIPSFAIEGYTRQGGGIDRPAHMWSAAKSNDGWFLYDPTWDARYFKNGGFYNKSGNSYFKVSPAIFIQTHLPFDPLFQFLNYPITYRQFLNGSAGERNVDNYFNYIDSIEVYNSSDPEQRFLSSLQRIKKTNWPSSKIDTKIKRIQFELEVRYQDHEVASYDSSVNSYNQAINLYNSYLTYRNNQFQPSKSNEELQLLFKEIRSLISKANKTLAEVRATKANLVMDTGALQNKLDQLNENLHNQETILKDHLK